MKRFLTVLAILGIVLIVMGGGGIIDNSKPVTDYNTLTIDKLKKGMVVAGDVTMNMGCLEESYRTRNGIKSGSSTYYYAVLLDQKLIAVSCGSSKKQEFDNQSNLFYSYLEDENTVLPKVAIKGKVRSMSSDTRKYLVQSMEEAGLKDIFEIAPYTISANMISMNASIGLVVGGFLLMLFPLIILIKGLRDGSSYSRGTSGGMVTGYDAGSSSSLGDSAYSSGGTDSYSTGSGSYGTGSGSTESTAYGASEYTAATAQSQTAYGNSQQMGYGSGQAADQQTVYGNSQQMGYGSGQAAGQQTAYGNSQQMGYGNGQAADQQTVYGNSQQMGYGSGQAADQQTVYGNGQQSSYGGNAAGTYDSGSIYGDTTKDTGYPSFAQGMDEDNTNF